MNCFASLIALITLDFFLTLPVSAEPAPAESAPAAPPEDVVAPAQAPAVETAVEVVPETAPEVAKKAVPETVREDAPQAAPETTPETTTEAAPELVPAVVKKATPDTVREDAVPAVPETAMAPVPKKTSDSASTPLPPVSPVPLQAVPVAPVPGEHAAVSPLPLQAVPVTPEAVSITPQELSKRPAMVTPLKALPVEPANGEVKPLVAESPAGLREAVTPVASPVDDAARFLAGLPPVRDPLLIELAEQRSWKRHASQLDKAWEGLEKGRLAKVRKWSATHIPVAASAQGNVFYMFSGPDFLYANAIYPGATSFVFCGVEPVGPIPDLKELRRSSIPGELESLRSSLDSVLSFSFFITKKMKKDLYNHQLKGALPVICIFMARADKTISDVEYVGIDKNGVLSTIEEPRRRGAVTAPGVKVTFHDRGSEVPRTLYYFSTDISDSGLKSTGFLKFCKGLAPGNSLVKSASYLMHKSYFSTVRSFLLENTETLVQDDSGIPVSYFPPTEWELRLFGRYPGPIPLFKDHTQRKLHELYRDANPVPLDFGIGYRHRKGESMLMVAKFRTEVETEDAPKAVLLVAAPAEVPEKVPVVEIPMEKPKEVPREREVVDPPSEEVPTPVAPASVPESVPVAEARPEAPATVQAVHQAPGAESAPAVQSEPLPQ